MLVVVLVRVMVVVLVDVLGAVLDSLEMLDEVVVPGDLVLVFDQSLETRHVYVWWCLW